MRKKNKSELIASPSPAPETSEKGKSDEDASRGEVFLYAFGNIEGGVAAQFMRMLRQIMIVTMQINPMLMGLVGSINVIVDGITDPIMAYVTDNTRSRWGRRKPYILTAGITRILFLVLIIVFFPRNDSQFSNAYLETDRQVKDAKAAYNDGLPLLKEAYARPVADWQVERPFAERFLQGTKRFFGKQPTPEQTLIEEIRTSHEKLPAALETLRSDIDYREKKLQDLRAAADVAPTVIAKEEVLLKTARSRLELAKKLQVGVTDLLPLAQVVEARVEGTGPPSTADLAVAERAVSTLEPIEATVMQPPVPGKKAGMFKKIKNGWIAFKDPSNADQRTILLYFLVIMLIYSTLTTIHGAPNYAFGMEICRSYDGRTRVAVYRGMINKIIGAITPWIPAFCFLLWFSNALDALLWIALFACIIGIPSTILMVIFVKERQPARVAKRGEKGHIGFFKSLALTFQNPLFWRYFFIKKIMGMTWAVFMGQMGFYLNIYWVMGSALKGAGLSGIVQMIAWLIALIALPLVSWACKRFEKHRFMQFSVIWMAIGALLQWWAVNPAYPLMQLVLPFFTSFGIICYGTVTHSLLADITDDDALRTGQRREGIFAAVTSLTEKMLNTVNPILTGLVLVAFCGFDPKLGFDQSAQTITNMRICYSFIPAGLMLITLLLLKNYPLTRARVADIKKQLRLQEEQAVAD